nr:hypothetical protein [Tanacetum cinerariifolium]
ALKSKPTTSKKKLKGAMSLTLAEQDTNICKLSRKVKRQAENNQILEAHMKELVVNYGFPMSPQSSLLPQEDGQDSEHSDDDNDDSEKDEKDGDVDDEGDAHIPDKQDDDDEDDETESDEDDIYKYKIRVSKGFGDQFLKLSFDSSLVSTVKDSADADRQQIFLLLIVTETLVTTADPSPQVTPIISTVQQTTTPIPTPTITTDAPIVTTIILESNALTVVELRAAKLEKDVFELKIGDHSSVALVVHQSYVPTVVDSYLCSKHLLELTKKPTPTVEKESEKSPLEILKIKKEQAESQKNPQFSIKSTEKVALKEYDLKSVLYQSMHANKSFNKNPTNHRLYHALMEVLIEDENAMDKGVADIAKDHKRKHDDDEDDDEDPPAGLNQGKKTKRRRTKESESSKKSSSTKETPKEPIAEVIMNDVGDDLVRDDDQPQATSKPSKTLSPEWFKQPSSPPTPDPECNKQGDRYPLDLSKPLPLQRPSGHRTIAVDYFFNIDLEYLKTFDPEVIYTTSITMTKAARYEIKGIKDMVPTLWSTIKHAYNKDVSMGIKH